MVSISLNHSINQPSVEDYNTEYVRMPCNSENKQAIFQVLADPENIHRAIIFIEETGGSPIALYEGKLLKASESGWVEQLTNHEKQFVGTVTRFIMERNGFSKSDRKQRFTKGIFKSGEIYSPA